VGYDLGRYIRIKETLKQIEHKRCMGAIVRSRARYVVEGERCTKYFLGLEKCRQKSKEGEKIFDLVGIAVRVEEFYRVLFRKGETDEGSIGQVLEKVGARLSEEDREMCEGEIRKEEIEAAWGRRWW